MQKVLQETQQVSNDILSVHKDSFEGKYRGYFFQNFYLQGIQAGIKHNIAQLKYLLNTLSSQQLLLFLQQINYTNGQLKIRQLLF